MEIRDPSLIITSQAGRDISDSPIAASREAQGRYDDDGTHRIYVSTQVDENDVSKLEGVTAFLNDEEVTLAMRDPRYKTSSPYRNLVNKRLSITR